MEVSESDSLFFSDTLADYDFTSHIGYVVHILCIGGNLSFTLHRTRYDVSSGDYVILTNGVLVSFISQSEDCRIVVMSFAESFITTHAIRSNYGIIGHLSLLQNPVMKLAAEDFDKCWKDMERLRERLADRKHLFREEMIGALLKAHVLDLYDIHARANEQAVVSSRPATLMREFIDLLLDGDYISDRSLDYFANRLCVTPHYLSEISKSVSGQPATYWIDRFVTGELSRLLMQPELSLASVADHMNFSSVSYLCRYVKKKLGVTPSEYRSYFRR
ncbi:helix-turn-helix domain-containing protein [uncultured Bacteroides sp.]|uniref:helix-turn-helix domain-containing protein n=1 Tax=uncultured Bacteroides sp. TaxID=162156 RepID=UPI00280B7580|nr:helix-turn-helix domain-containing protein [uncultured Bacteroides sp.]